MEIINYVPGLRSKNPKYKIISLAYYAVSASFITKRGFLFVGILLFTMPFIIFGIRDIYINKTENKGSKVHNILRCSLIVALASFLCVILIDTQSKEEKRVYELQDVQKEVEKEIEEINKQNQKLIDKQKNTYEYKVKEREYEAIKEKIEDENIKLVDERDRLKKFIEENFKGK